jgi:hypothetical protein
MYAMLLFTVLGNVNLLNFVMTGGNRYEFAARAGCVCPCLPASAACAAATTHAGRRSSSSSSTTYQEDQVGAIFVCAAPPSRAFRSFYKEIRQMLLVPVPTSPDKMAKILPKTDFNQVSFVNQLANRACTNCCARLGVISGMVCNNFPTISKHAVLKAVDGNH